MRTLKPNDEPRDTDGTPLIINDEVAEMAGLTVGVINHYNVWRRRKTGKHSASGRNPLPAPVARQLQPVVRGDGVTVRIWRQLWREDDIKAWVARKQQCQQCGERSRARGACADPYHDGRGIG